MMRAPRPHPWLQVFVMLQAGLDYLFLQQVVDGGVQAKSPKHSARSCRIAAEVGQGPP